MKLSRRIAILLLVAALVFSSLAGCASPDQTATPKADPAEEGAATPAAKTTEAAGDTLADGEEVVLNFPCIWVATDTLAGSFAEVLADFNEEYAGEVKIVIEEQTDYVAYRDKIRTLVSAGSAPDIFLIESQSDADTFAESGNLLDMTPYADEEWTNTFSSGLLDAAKFDGKLYSVPFELAYWPVIYNTELVAEAGFDTFPTNYEDFWTLCDNLVANGVTPMTMMTGENAYTSMLWMSQAAIAAGGKDGATVLEDDAMVKAAEITQKFFDYTTSDAIGSTAVISRSHFMNEKTAIYMNGPWCFGLFAKEGAEGLEDKIALTTAPTLDGGEGEQGYVMSNVQQRIAFANQTDPAKADAAAAFLKYLTSKDTITKFTGESGRFFAVDVGEVEGLGRLQNDLLGLISKAPYLAPNMQMLSTPAQNEIPTVLDSLAFGDYTPEEAVDALIAVQ